MATTTIQIDAAARDRLRILAAERGTTIGGIVEELAQSQLTEDERRARGARVAAYLTANISPDYAADTEAHDHVASFLDELRAGRVPEEL